MLRADGRGAQELRPVVIEPGFVRHAAGSALVRAGDTVVLCTVSVEGGIPAFLRGSGQGWLTAEYGMLPASTHTRTPREVSRGRPAGRTMEIQRLIGRSLRAVTDLSALGERTLWVDCDVLQADGGTRTAGITGAYVALVQALAGMVQRGELARLPLSDWVAAVSVGVVDGEALLDLCYAEDSRAEVDMTLVATGSRQLIELQGTAERRPFDDARLQQLLALGHQGIQALIDLQRRAVGAWGERIGGADPGAGGTATVPLGAEMDEGAAR